ncbi:Moesin/ezrin/radixin-like protein 1 [Aphelenchoides fujianensis]|nr:Moesin/ezrin/radixin-like protein 1 [Aphelenchoides fujianensis]
MATLLRSLSRRFKTKNGSSGSNQFDPKSQLQCKVIFLDGSDLTIVLDKKALGQDACNKVFVHLDIEETDYFGLTFTDHDNIQHWLDPYKRIRKQIPRGRAVTFRFQVKFFSSEPANLQEEFTRYLFFLQLKLDIRTGKLFCPKESAITLAALQLQSEFGDYNPARAQRGLLFPNSASIPTRTRRWRASLFRINSYTQLAGISPGEAERQYLDVAKISTALISTRSLQKVMILSKTQKYKIDGQNYRLGLTPSGVVVFDQEVLVGVLFWQFIQAVNFSNRRLTIVIDEHSSNEIQQHTFVFSVASNSACKRLWKRAVEFHTFYRMRRHRPARRNATEQFFRLSSSYQHRGRTEFENVNRPRRERSVVTFERKPSQRYGPRQSHVQRLRQEEHRAAVLQKAAADSSSSPPRAPATAAPIAPATPVVSAPVQVPVENTPPKEPFDANVTDDGGNRTYTVSANESVFSANGTQREMTPVAKAAVAAAARSAIAERGADEVAARPAPGQPPLYEIPADAVLTGSENFEAGLTKSCVGDLRTPHAASNGTKTTFIPIIQNARSAHSRVATQL